MVLVSVTDTSVYAPLRIIDPLTKESAKAPELTLLSDHGQERHFMAKQTHDDNVGSTVRFRELQTFPKDLLASTRIQKRAAATGKLSSNVKKSSYLHSISLK